MENPAGVDDLTNLGYVGPASRGEQLTRLNAAWRALRREVPSIQTSLDQGELEKSDVADVLAAAVLRVLRNPEGVQEESGAIDDYRESIKRADATADLYFTSAELRRLAPASAALGGFVGSVKYL